MLWSRARLHNGPTHLTCVGLCVVARARATTTPWSCSKGVLAFLRRAETIKPKKDARGNRASGKSNSSGRFQLSWGIDPQGVTEITGGRGQPPTSKTWADLTASGRDIFLKPREVGQGKQTYKRGTIQKQKATKPNHKSVGAVEC